MDKSGKVRAEHLQRLAAVYVRQSHPMQVREHTASTAVQYDLVDRAVAFGWPRDRVVVYAGDLGHTATIPDDREEFGRLAADVGMRRLGLVLGFDVTRMARNNADWYKLFDMCAICDTLIGDTDGLYHPGVYNDRLILGLKGMMSEAESHLRRERMHSAIEKRASNGELRKHLPVGLEYDEERRVRLAVDESVRQAIELVFRKFAQLGSAHQVYRFLQSEGLVLPTRRSNEREVRWIKPRYSTVFAILTNPRYAGAYVYGRRRRQKSVDGTGRICLRTERVPRDQWKVVLQDEHPGYIPWVTFVDNQKRLSENALRNAAGEGALVVREGRALLQGLVRCGVCGRRMSPLYPSKGDSVRYACHARNRSHGEDEPCQSVGGRRLHRAVVDEFLDALSPASMEVALAALDQMDHDEDAVLAQLLKRREQAHYEADRAKRQYDAVEPENRLVARTLEAEWNRKLTALAQVEQAIEERRHQKSPPLTPEERQRVLELGLDLRRIWSAPTTLPQERKQLLRAVFDDVVVRVHREARRAELTLVWQGGETTMVDVRLRRVGQNNRAVDEDVVEDIRKMAVSMTDAQIAQTLVRRGVRTPTGLPYTIERVRAVRKRHDIAEHVPSPPTNGVPLYTAEEVAEKLGVSHVTALRWLKEGFLAGDQATPYAPWRIRLGPELKLKLADRAPPTWLPLKRAAKALGVGRRAVLHWVQAGKLEAVMAGTGRRSGLRINVSSSTCTTQPSLFDQPGGQGLV